MSNEDNVVPFPRPLKVEDIRSYKDVVEWFNRDHFTTYLKGKYKVVRENPDSTIDIMDQKDFIGGHKELKLRVTTEDGKDFKYIPFNTSRACRLWPFTGPPMLIA
jgi:hypothetical protein